MKNKKIKPVGYVILNEKIFRARIIEHGYYDVIAFESVFRAESWMNGDDTITGDNRKIYAIYPLKAEKNRRKRK